MIKGILRHFLKKKGYQLSPLKDFEPVVYRAFYLDHCFYCFRDSIVGQNILSGKGWDNNLKQMILECFKRKESRTIVEVGANVGASLMPICSDFSDAVFYMFEPIPESFDLLEKNKKSFKVTNAHLFNYAISDEANGYIDIHCAKGTAGARPEGKVYKTERMKTHTLDQIFPTEKVAFIKIDVDGFEPNVLSGAAELIARSKPDVFFEFYPELIRRASKDPSELLELLISCGLTEFNVYDNFGHFIETTTSSDRTLEIAEGVEFYVDILARVAND